MIKKHMIMLILTHVYASSLNLYLQSGNFCGYDLMKG